MSLPGNLSTELGWWSCKSR